MTHPGGENGGKSADITKQFGEDDEIHRNKLLKMPAYPSKFTKMKLVVDIGAFRG